MADEKKPFSELLNEAPLAPDENTVTLTGALARSSQPGKFVLATGAGNSVTLDVDAVKDYQVLGGGVGQVLVQLTVDRAKMPEAAQSAVKSENGIAQSGWPDIKHPIVDKYPWEEPVKIPGGAHPAATSFGTIHTGVHDIKSPIQDYKHPILDKYPWEEPVKIPGGAEPAATPLGTAHTGVHDATSPVMDYKHPILDKYPWEEPVRYPEKGWDGAAPFALSTAQQAPESALTAMQGAPGAALGTIVTLDVRTGIWDHYKRPILDATGRPPYLD